MDSHQGTESNKNVDVQYFSSSKYAGFTFRRKTSVSRRKNFISEVIDSNEVV
jgi:hypothetical protein